MDYPKHADAFELYYYLGDDRSLKKVAQLRFSNEFPDIPPGTREYNSKFESYYVKIKRWSKKENWNEWVKRKEEEDRQKRDEEIREHSSKMVEMVKLYRKMIRYALSDLARRIREGEVRIRNLTEAKSMIELDLYLTRVLQESPQFLPSMVDRILDEKGKKLVDAVFEHLHKRTLMELGSAEVLDAELVKEEDEDK